MAEQSYAEARGVALVAGAMLVVAVVVAAIFVIIGLTAGPPVAPPAV